MLNGRDLFFGDASVAFVPCGHTCRSRSNAVAQNVIVRKLGGCKLLLTLLILCLFPVAGRAQLKTSAITGVVTDSSGAVVPNATVAVVEQQTNVAHQSKTDGVGQYTVPYLPEGRYSVTVKSTGFKTYVKTGITLETATAVRVDAALVPGSVSETVQVTANSATLQTENATVQGAVDANVIEAIPDINRNPLLFAGLQAGVVPDPQALSSNTMGVGWGDRLALSAIRINGSEVGTDDVQLDGVSVQGSGWHEMAVMPDTDSLQEVRTTTNNFTAQTGNAQGVIAMTTKSGTNQFHGDVYYTLRNEILNANWFNDKLQGIRRPKYRVNQAGFSLGGPVRLPHLYNGTNKMFFFVNLMGQEHIDPLTFQTRVPSDLERQGDFSQTMVQGINGVPENVNLYNPWTAQFVGGSTTVVQRQQYAGAKITNPNSFGLKLLQAYPEPTLPGGTDAFQDNNYQFVGSRPADRYALVTRWDFKPGEKTSLYTTFGMSFGSRVPENEWGPKSAFYTGGTEQRDRNPYGSIGYTYTLNPTTFIDLHYGITRVSAFSSYPNSNWTDYSSWGMSGAEQGLIAVQGVPMDVTLGGNLESDTWERKNEHQTNHDVSGNFTKIVGRWTFKAGADYRVYLANFQDVENGTPVLSAGAGAAASTEQYAGVSGQAENSYNTDPANRGYSEADLLTGVGGFSSFPGAETVPAIAAKYTALYSQNDWKVTRKLTFNLGLRWEIQPGPTERYNHTADFNPNQANPYAGSPTGVTLTDPRAGMGVIEFPGTNGLPRNMWNTQWGNFSPRFGAVYQLTNSTVVRGGFGRMYTESNSGYNANGEIYGQGPYAGGAQSLPYGLSPDGVPVGSFDNPAATVVTGGYGAVQSPYLYGDVQGSSSVDMFERNFPNSYVDEWNLFVEREIGKSWIASVGYVGSHGYKLPWRNFPLEGTWSVPSATLAAYRAGWIASSGAQNPANVRVANPFPALIGKATGSIGSATIPAIMTNMPYLALYGQDIVGSAGETQYNAMQFNIRHPFSSSGLTLIANYTWSKATGLTGGNNASDYEESQAGSGSTNAQGGNDYLHMNRNHGLQLWDIPQRMMATVVYKLPFNSGQRFEPTNRILRAVASGWQIASMVNVQSGKPFSPNCGGGMDGRCDIVPGEPVMLPKSLQHWYDGKTSVTLPDGRIITPQQYTRLRYNPDRFTAPIVQFPNGKYAEDEYWYGQTGQIVKGYRSPNYANVNLSLERDIAIHENKQFVLRADSSNLFNHANMMPDSVSASSNVVTTPGPTLGMNSNYNAGDLTDKFYDPRQITLSAYLRF